MVKHQRKEYISKKKALLASNRLKFILSDKTNIRRTKSYTHRQLSKGNKTSQEKTSKNNKGTRTQGIKSMIYNILEIFIPKRTDRVRLFVFLSVS